MNGDEKEEAHRPRPLSAGIWTLFSWLRRSERSSSSESISSVGSARTAVSFDFLAPGNYNFSSKPIVLTTPLNPPTETYKRRLEDRNLRRQRDRDVTLHRKYGLFRDHGNGYDGYTLPPARRTLGNTSNRQNRDRRATSESLPRRAAYVPGKRRAPLPPTIATSASLPRTYKRKRPAPKPPINNIFINNNIHLIDNPVRMTSKSESETKFDNELLNSNKNQKNNKKIATSKDTKSKTDKSFLKHIFENKKRSSVIETTSVRLLPSISELDKQATEIIENKKLRQKINNNNPDNVNNFEDTKAIYEGNSWFCTSCLRKFCSSVDSCNYCLPDKRNSLQSNGLIIQSPRASIYTQTNVNGETATSSRNSVDERKVLKEILKEMKDSLPKKSKDNKVNYVITETPTLRIGSTVQETYKEITPEPSSSSEISHNKNRVSISTPFSETERNIENIVNNQSILSDIRFSDQKNLKQYKVSPTFENINSVKNAPARCSLSAQKHLSSKIDEHKEENNNTNHLTTSVTNKSKENNSQEINVTNVTEDKHHKTTNLKDPINVKNIGKTHSHLPLLSTKTNNNKETNNGELRLSHETSKNILLDNNQHIVKDKIHKDNTCSSQNQGSSTSTDSNVSKSDLVVPKQSKLLFSKFPNSQSVVVNTVTVVTTHSSAESLKKLDNVKPEYNLHTPLKISSLLNPVYIPNKTAAKENVSTETHAATKFAKNELPSKSTALKTIVTEKKDTKVNKEEFEVTPRNLDSKTRNLVNDLPEPQVKIEARVEDKTPKDDISKQKVLPSTSGCSRSTQSIQKDVVILDHYDQRRHLINQLEQSIAKGDEIAAAEAAVKLAKLRLSCSVLSFSSQIVGETKTKAKQNEINKQSNFPDTSATSSKDKSTEQNILQASNKSGEVDINSQINSSKLVKNEKITEKVATKSSNLPNKPQSSGEPSTSNQVISENTVPINVWIEDKQAARGPIRLNISRRATVADLRRQAEQSLGVATRLQRWIVGRTLCSDDTSLIVSLAGPYLTAPFYLCIVQPDQEDKPITTEVINDIKNIATGNNGEFYTELMNLEKQSLVPNIEPFECGVCMEECAAGAGVILRECIHSFCRECLSDVVQHSQEPAVACPATGCSGFLQEREIRTIVTPEEYERWLARGLATAECGTRNTFHCRTTDCTGWAFCDPGVRRFPCPVCKNTNCVQCQAIHEGETCEQYQTKLRQAVTAAETNKDDEGTQALLNSLISKGEALECPECRAIITKKWGCDWVKCSACKTEICWVTKGRRWGPGGRGDTSGGCRCGVDGQRCHPSCGYCH